MADLPRGSRGEEDGGAANREEQLVHAAGHLSLRSMRERATRLGGTLEVLSAPDV